MDEEVQKLVKCGIRLGHAHCLIDSEKKLVWPSQNISQDFDCQCTRNKGTFINSINSEVMNSEILSPLSISVAENCTLFVP